MDYMLTVFVMIFLFIFHSHVTVYKS